MTYPNDSWVVGHWRWGRLLLCRFFDAQVLHIASAEDNLLVDCIRRTELVLAAPATLRTK